MDTSEVTFRPKPSGQKNDCINRNAEYDCPNESTLVAVCGTAIIRCCTDEKCKKVATEMAVASDKALSRK